MVSLIIIAGIIIFCLGIAKYTERNPFNIPLNWGVMVGIGSALVLVGLFGFAKGAFWPQKTDKEICLSQSKFWVQEQCTEIPLSD